MFEVTEKIIDNGKIESYGTYKTLQEAMKRVEELQKSVMKDYDGHGHPMVREELYLNGNPDEIFGYKLYTIDEFDSQNIYLQEIIKADKIK